MALSRFPGAWKGTLSVIIDNLPILNNHVDSPQVQLVIIGDHVVERVVRLILQPLALACGLRNLVSRENRSLSISPAVDHESDVVGFIDKDGLVKIFPMHHGGVGGGSIRPGAEPGHTLFYCYSLRNWEGPVYWVQLRVPVSAAVEADICPGKEARVGGDVPFPFLLQELKSRGTVPLEGCGPDATLTSQNAALRLDFRGVRTIVGREVVSCLDCTVSVSQGKAVRHHHRASMELLANSGSNGQQPRKSERL